MNLFDQEYAPRRSVRLDTLLRLRWLAVIGQVAAVLVVQYGFDFEIDFPECLTVIALYAALTVFVRLKLRGQRRIAAKHAALLLASDIAELAALLALTGGLQNPFAFLFLGPVLISATALPARMTMGLAGFAILCATALVFVHDPLPWASDEPLELPAIYMIGIWLSIMLAIGYISIYAWQITEEGRQLADALAATELVLEREQHLSQLDGLAAAAAHELGTPLAIISVVSRELERALEDSPHAEDVRILRDQAMRCREILGKLAERPTPDEPFEHLTLSALIEDVVAPRRRSGIEIVVTSGGDGSPEPVGGRNPAILYGLGNLLENALDFATKRVDMTANWTATLVHVSIRDDGPGFLPEILARLGEPYVRGPRPQQGPAAADEAGLGLGFFIAKTLLERSGAQISMENVQSPSHGAVIQIEWDRDTFERPYAPVARPAALSRDG
ncbi:MAG: ActS/PrrB/RegB family redox-sensitive histidine kinase [Xanthobacteraceae bacterium]